VRTCIVQSHLLRGRGAINEARAVMELTLTRATAALALQPTGEGHMYMGAGLANAHLELAQVMFHPVAPSFGRSADALAQYHRAEAVSRALMERHADLAALDRKAPPGSFSNMAYLRSQVGTIMGSRALIYLRTGQVPEALAEVEAAMVLRRRNVADDPRHVWWRQGLMAEAATWAQCLLLLGRPAEGLSAATLAWDTMQALAVDEGPQSKWARPPTRALVGLPYGWALLTAGRAAEAQAVLEPTLAHWGSQTGAEAEAKAAQVQALLAQARTTATTSITATATATATTASGH
jgi:eukaryotic-like serine/threonine-protein kinase